jgi:hypothetical protein
MTKMQPPNRKQRFFLVEGSPARIWSAQAPGYVGDDDPDYVEWKKSGGVPMRVGGERALSVILNGLGLQTPTVLPGQVTQEAARRMVSGFAFQGRTFQSDVESQKRAAGAVTMAILAVIAGKQPGDLRWHDGDDDFYWIASDNARVPMDSQTVVAFGKAAGEWESQHVYAARKLKDMQPIPLDYTDDKHWPRADIQEG